MSQRNEPKKDLLHFSKQYDESHASKAYSARGEFISKFPIASLNRMKLDSYVAGKGTYSFCNAVESRTDGWARIKGATSFKFGVYYGVTKSDNTKKYRFARKFGSEYKQAFHNVRKSLLKLLDDAKSKSFQQIDENPISQMFKAKIISLYYPELYINICSEEHLRELAHLKGFPDGLCTSHYQNLLIEDRNENTESSSWSNPKYMKYLYKKYIRKTLYSDEKMAFRKPNKKSEKEVDFAEIQKVRDELGKRSEDYVLEWERNRLIGIDCSDLANRIINRTKNPKYGYDFLSYESDGKDRLIEVKSIAKLKANGEETFRFFLSENEKSISEQFLDSYYFYMVKFDNKLNPIDLYIKKASKLYENAEIEPCAYKVRFSIE